MLQNTSSIKFSSIGSILAHCLVCFTISLETKVKKRANTVTPHCALGRVIMETISSDDGRSYVIRGPVTPIMPT